MTPFVITSILLTYYLIPFGNCVYLPNGQNIPNDGNHLSGTAGGGAIPPDSSPVQDKDNPSNQQPNSGREISGYDAGSLQYPNDANPSYPRLVYPSINVNSVNNAVSSSSSQPSSYQSADDQNSSDDF